MRLTTQLSSKGLTDQAVIQSRAEHGRNVLTTEVSRGLLATMKEVVTEPIFLLLVAACTIYFVLGRIEDWLHAYPG